jgi:mono/diheme cytochrome c family protein
VAPIYSRMRRCLFVAVFGLYSTSLFAGNPGPDPLVVRGRQLARIVCSQCHVISPDQDLSPSLEVAAPSFEAIANRRATSEKYLRHFISSTHWDGQTIPMTMPAPGLTKQETAAVAAYIMSLRKSERR